MTIEQFFLKLSESSAEWNTDPRIECRINNILHCPLTEVALRYGKYFSLDEFEEAAEYLGLSKFLGHKIASAADGNGYELRKQLLTAIGK